MGLLQDGMTMLQGVLSTTVLYEVRGTPPVELIGIWTSTNYDSERDVGNGARRTDAEAVFHVRQGQLASVDQGAAVIRGTDRYRISHVEPIQDATWRLHLNRDTGRAASPLRSAFQG